jgi:hypothetical protein
MSDDSVAQSAVEGQPKAANDNEADVPALVKGKAKPTRLPTSYLYDIAPEPTGWLWFPYIPEGRTIHRCWRPGPEEELVAVVADAPGGDR